jgi:hypothetical protein
MAEKNREVHQETDDFEKKVLTKTTMYGYRQRVKSTDDNP